MTGYLSTYRITKASNGELVMIAPMWVIAKAFLMEHPQPKNLMHDLILNKSGPIVFNGTIGGSRFDVMDFVIEINEKGEEFKNVNV